MIINERLKAWATKNNIITDAQFGFKADYNTVDAIFILESLVNKAIRDKKPEDQWSCRRSPSWPS